MTGIILAGGKNKRIKTDKAFLKIGSVPLIDGLVAKLDPVFESILIVTNTPQNYEYLGVSLVEDQWPGRGPLVGIYSGLSVSIHHYNFVVACDMPFINIDLIRYMMDSAAEYDLVVPKLESGYETLCAVYSKNCLQPIQRQLRSNNLKVIDFFDQVKVREITPREVRRFDPDGICFFNINTIEDFESSKEMV